MKDKATVDRVFEKLFRDYFRPLTVYAMQFVKDQETAEDIVQDLFLYLFENKESFHIQNLASNFLFKLVRYRCLNKLDYQKLRIEKNPEIQDTLNSNPVDPHELAVIIEIEHKYLQVLESLSPKCQKVFEMSRMEGRKNQEIADELRLSKRTVETHITLALKVLRRKLHRYLTVMAFYLYLMEFFSTCKIVFNCYS